MLNILAMIFAGFLSLFSIAIMRIVKGHLLRLHFALLGIGFGCAFVDRIESYKYLCLGTYFIMLIIMILVLKHPKSLKR